MRGSSENILFSKRRKIVDLALHKEMQEKKDKEVAAEKRRHLQKENKIALSFDEFVHSWHCDYKEPISFYLPISEWKELREKYVDNMRKVELYPVYKDFLDQVFPRGTRVKLISLREDETLKNQDKKDLPSPGEEGELLFHEGRGNLAIKWDKGSSLPLLQEDDFIYLQN